MRDFTYETFFAYETGGTTPYTYNFLVYNSVTNKIIGNFLVSSTTANTYTFQVPSYWTSNNLFYANVFVKDSATTNSLANSILSNPTVTVNTAPSVTIAPSSAQTYAPGELVTFTAIVSGGSAPYTYNFLVYNSITNTLVANMITSSSSFTYVIPSWENGNTLNANVFITDNVNVMANSILSGTITVASVTATPNPFTLSNTILDIGQYSFANTIISGGSGGFIGNWSWSMNGASVGNVTGSTGTGTWQNSANSLSAAEGGLSCTAYNSYIYCPGGTIQGSTIQSAKIYSGTNVIGIWANSANSLKLPEQSASCISYNSYIYCMGGSDVPSAVQSAQIYSGTNVISTWASSANSLATSESGSSCTAYNSYIYCSGGTTSSTVQSAQIYGSGIVGTWQTTNSLTAGVSGNEACAAYNNYIYCSGGGSGSVVESAPIYSGTNVIGTWTTTNSLATSIVGFCSVHNSYIYCSGGGSGGSTVQYAQIYSGTNVIGAWQTTNSLATAESTGSCVEYNGYLYCPVGSSTVESANILTQAVFPLQSLPTSNNALSLEINPTSSTSVSMTYLSNTITVTASGTNTIYGTWTFNGFAQDSQAGSTITSTNTITINPTLTTPSLVASNTAVNAGTTYETFSAYESGGSTPYTYNFLVYNSITNTIIGNYLIASPTNTYTFQVPSYWTSNNLFYANVFVTDNANSKANSVLTGTITVNTGLATPTIAASNTVVDAGTTYETFSAYESGGSTPYTYNFLVYNSITNTIIGNYLIASPTNTYTFQVPSYWTSNNLFYANVFVTDNANSKANSVLTGTITVNTGLATPTIAASNTVVDAGTTYETFSAYESGGSTPYTYNFLVYNSITNTIIGNYLIASPTNTYTFQVPSYWTSNNLFYANVFVTDNANSKANSVLTGTITVNTGLATPTIAASNTVVDAGTTYETFSAYEFRRKYSIHIQLPGIQLDNKHDHRKLPNRITNKHLHIPGSVLLDIKQPVLRKRIRYRQRKFKGEFSTHRNNHSKHRTRNAYNCGIQHSS